VHERERKVKAMKTSDMKPYFSDASIKPLHFSALERSANQLPYPLAHHMKTTYKSKNNGENLWQHISQMPTLNHRIFLHWRQALNNCATGWPITWK
jgi:hypothetical protein